MAFVQNDEIFHYHTDHFGTPQDITNAKGNIVWSANYRAYGNLALANVEEVENNLRFQGQYYDEESGLHYNRFRYYDPSCGRFITQDPIGLEGGTNNYQYVPNPVAWVDPFGLTSKESVCSSGSQLHTRGYKAGEGERSLTKEQYQRLVSSTRPQGIALQAQLLSRLDKSDYVYRATTNRTLGYYRDAGKINRDAYMTFDNPGLDPKVSMDKSQVFESWGDHEVLLRIPASEVTEARVPRPLGGSLGVGWEPITEAYPAAGSGGNSQFLAQTKSWDESWVIPMNTGDKSID